MGTRSDHAEQTDHPTAFADLLRSLRQGAGLTQRSLAVHSGVAQRTISDLERGIAQTPQTATLDLLADGLGLGEVDRIRLFEVAGRRARLLPRAQLLSSRPWAEFRRPLRGRDGLLSTIERIALPGTLLTLTGAAGIGKSRLALELARRAEAAGATVHALELAAVEHPEEALQAIGLALNAPPGSTTPAALAANLGGDPTLLLLDNADRLAAAGPTFVALAAVGPGLTVVATSRAPLGAAGEVAVAVPPLPVPDPADRPEDLAVNPAVLLFADRAQQAGATDLLARPEGAASIVARLDGVPLALELAAAQAGTLSPSALIDLLDHAGLSLLTGTPDEGDRHARIERTIAWSADRGSPDARRLFALLGAFAGTGSAEAVAAVADELGNPGLAAALPELIRAALVHEAAEDGRFGMLEPVRMVAAARLDADADAEAVRRAHARWFGRWAQRIGTELEGDRISAALANADADRGNAFAAARWALAAGEADLAAAIILPLCRLWWAQGQLDPLAGFVAELAAQADRVTDPGDRLLARWYASYHPFAVNQAAARRRVRELRATAEAEGDRTARAFAQHAESVFIGLDGDAETAVSLLREATTTLEESEHPFAWLARLRLGAVLPVIGETEEARALLAETVADLDRRGDEFNLPIPLMILGTAQVMGGRLDEARATFLRLLDLAERRRFAWPRALALMGMAHANSADPDLAAVEDGVRLRGACDAFLEQFGMPNGPAWCHQRADVLVRARSVMPPERLAAVLDEGRLLNVPEAVALARSRA